MNDSAEKSTGPVSGGKKRRRWRRVRRLAVLLLIVAVGGRIALALAMPWILDSVAASLELRCEYERLDLSILGGDVEIGNLVLRPLDRDAPLLELEYARLDVAMWPLLSGRLVVRRAEVDGLDVFVQRDRDGTFSFERHLAALRGEDGEEAVAEETAGEPIDFAPPIRVDAARVQHLQVHLSDRTRSPPFEARFDVNVRISHVGHPERKARMQIVAAAPRILDNLTIEGRGGSETRKADGRFTVRLAGLHPQRLAPYLTPLGIHPRASTIDLELNATAAIRPVATGKNDSTDVAAHLVVNGLRADADRDVFFSLDRLAVDTTALGPGRVDLERVEVRGIRGTAARTASGHLAVAGFELHGPERREQPAATGVTSRTEEESDRRSPAGAHDLGIHELACRDVQFEFHDAAVRPAADLKLRLRRFEVLGAVAGAAPPRLEAELSAPGVFERLTIDGEGSLRGARKSARFAVRVEGIEPTALEPYLAAIPIRATVKDGEISGRVAMELETGAGGRLSGTGSVDKLVYRDGDGTRFCVLEQARLEGFVHDPEAGTLAVQKVGILAGDVEVRREADGTIRALGLAFPSAPKPRAEPRAEKPTGEVVADRPAVFERHGMPRLSVPRLEARVHRIRFVDAMTRPENTLALDEAAVELDNLHVDGSGKATETPGSLKVSLKAPGVVEALSAAGPVASVERGVRVDLELSGRGITGRSAAPYLRAAGLDPRLSAGALEGKIEVEAKLTERGIRARASLERFVYLDDGAELVGLDALRIRDVAVEDGAVRIGAVELERPRVHMALDPHGAFEILGLGLIVPTPLSPGGNKRPAFLDATPTPGATEAKAAVPTTTLFELNRLHVAGAEAHFADHALGRPVKVSGKLGVEIEGVSTRRDAPPARIRIEGAVDGALDRFVVDGRLLLPPGGIQTSLELSADGLRCGPLAPYFPPGAVTALTGGMLRARVSVESAREDAGGHRLVLGVTGVDFRDGEKGPPLLAMDALTVRAPRIDPEARMITVDEVSVRGLAGEVTRLERGVVRVFGLTMPAARSEASAPEVGEPEKPGGARKLHVAPEFLRSRELLPQITLKKLDLQLERLVVKDDSRRAAAPLVLAKVRLHNLEPLVLDGTDPERSPPLQLRLTGSSPPVVGAFVLRLQATPFASEPGGGIEFSASGIRGDGITRLWPDLAEKIDGRPLTDGRLAFKCGVVYEGRRRHAFDYGDEKGFGLNFLLHGLSFRNGEKGDVLAGLDEVDLRVKKIVPATGEVHVSLLEIGKPIFRARREEAGLHALGVIVKQHDTSTKPAAPEVRAHRSETVLASYPAAANGSPARPAVPPQPKAEVRLDRLLVTGVDFEYRDRTASPPFVMPLNDLEVEVLNFTNRALTESMSIPFKVRLGAGDVALGNGKDGKADEQPFFQEVVTRGELFLAPPRRGWMKGGVSMLELTALRGVAAKQGIKINRGMADATMEMVRQPSGDLRIETEFVFRDLSLSEPPGGAIGRFLMLPAPLDTVIFVLRDRSGNVRVPLSFTVDARSGVSTTEITTEAVKVFGVLVAEALATSPFRVVGAVTDLTGLTAGGQARAAGDPVVVSFTPGVTRLTAREQAKVDQMLARLRKRAELGLALSAALGRKDIEYARVRANPSKEDCLALLAKLRRRKAAIYAERESLIARGRAAVAARLDAQVDSAVKHLKTLDLELGRLERSLDQLSQLLNPRADRYAGRRTRLAALALASARLHAVRRILIDAGGPELEKRIRISRPRYEAEPAVEQGTVRLRPVIGVMP